MHPSYLQGDLFVEVESADPAKLRRTATTSGTPSSISIMTEE